ncbi:MAG TPA: hypothetical protein VFL27_03485 [Candidatus Dormibacteraeota bacterium]|nr:hypothetical protein [Candidatus Dormibacteraeota bacterium]
MSVQMEAKPKVKYLRVKVVDNLKEGNPTVNIRMPIGLVKFGLKMAQSFSPDVKNMNLDYDAIDKMIEEGVVGELVHVEDDTQHKTIDVYVD